MNSRRTWCARATARRSLRFLPATRVLALVAVLVALGSLSLRRSSGSWLIAALDAARTGGWAGRFLFGLTYALAAVLMLPASPITVAAGHAFGPAVGVLVAAPAACAGACIPFLLARTVAHDFVARQLGRFPRFPILAEAIRRSGFKVVTLLRISPLVPFPVLNYLLGATPLRLRHFVAGSFLGMLPGTILYAWMGSLIPDAQDLVNRRQSSSWLVLLGLVLLTAGTATLARRALLVAFRSAAADAAAPGVAATPSTHSQSPRAS